MRALSRGADGDGMQSDEQRDFDRRLCAVEWETYETAYGPATTVPRLLKALRFGSPAESESASHELWCGLCHQHAYISNAALPAYEFLLEALNCCSKTLEIELLDIFLGFAVCSRSSMPDTDTVLYRKIRERLVRDRAVFERFSLVDDDDEFASRILEELAAHA